MNKIITSIVALSLAISSFAQDKYLTKDGHIWFSSQTPIEKFEAHNNSVGSSLNLTTGDIQFVLFMKSFKFQQALMEEHFNENYAETDQFPKASFKGKLPILNQLKLLQANHKLLQLKET